MRTLLAALPIALAAGASAAMAQDAPPVPPSTQDTGFFRPYPYPALQSPMPEAAPRSFLTPNAGQQQPFAHWSSPQRAPMQAAPQPAMQAVQPPAAPPAPAAPQAPAAPEPYSAVTSPNAPVVNPDGTITPPQQPAAPAPAAQAAAAPPTVVVQNAPAVPPAVRALERMEQQMDRIEDANERAHAEGTAAAAGSVGAAFDGTTSERNR
jgi:hypothetical protein